MLPRSRPHRRSHRTSSAGAGWRFQPHLAALAAKGVVSLISLCRRYSLKGAPDYARQHAQQGNISPTYRRPKGGLNSHLARRSARPLPHLVMLAERRQNKRSYKGPRRRRLHALRGQGHLLGDRGYYAELARQPSPPVVTPTCHPPPHHRKTEP